jgi:hypothetical protein
MKKSKKATVPLVEPALKRHFRKQPLLELVTASRTFPPTARVDIQLALDKIFSKQPDAKLLGVHTQFQHEALTIAHLLGGQHFPVLIGPLQNEEIDIGEVLPIRCLRQGLWLAQQQAVPFALLLAPANPHFGPGGGVHIEIAVPTGEAGSQLSRRFLDDLEDMIRQTASYRGKVISFEHSGGFSGKHSPLRVHKLRSVQRDEVILRFYLRRHCFFLIVISGNLCVSVSSLGGSGCPSRKVSFFMGHRERGRLIRFIILPVS